MQTINSFQSSSAFLICIYGVLLLSTLEAFSQNLVPNPDFEEYHHCPTYFNDGNATNLFKWTSADMGTPDYYNRCSKTNAGVPYNWAGTSEAKSGDGYAGIYVYMPGGYREYLQNTLLSPLEKGENYLVRFFYKQASNSEFLTGNIGLMFSGFISENSNQKMDTILHHSDSISFGLADQWRLFEEIYQARGGEKILIIGNYAPSSEMEKIKIPFRYVDEPMLNNSSYFYIDNVSIIQLSEPEEVAPEGNIIFPDINIDEPLVLDNVLFDFNSSTMNPSSFGQLDSLVFFLEENALNIEVRGFTDSIGSETYNLALAKARSNSVASYLIEKGIKEDRVKAVGFGELLPTSSNESDEGRKQNRRVEIIFFRVE